MRPNSLTDGRPDESTGPRGVRWRRAVSAGAVGAALVGVGVIVAPTAMAAVTATSTSVAVAATGTTAIPGVSVGGALSSDTLNVTVSSTVGSLSLPTTTGLTVANNYTFTGPIISFTGLQAAVNSDLATLTLTTSGAPAGTPATVSVSAYVDQPGFIYSPSNQHFYTYVSSGTISWSAAETAAAGLSYTPSGLSAISGYLASIPNDNVNTLIATHVPGASNFWIGAHSNQVQTGTGHLHWQWSDGPLAGGAISDCTSNSADTPCDFTTGVVSPYSHWQSGEPNNANGTENVGADSYNGAGFWNDFTPSSSVVTGYLVEFGNQVTGSSTGTGVATASGTLPVYAAPSAPTGVTATVSGTSATVSWTPSSSTGGYALTGSTVTASPGGAACTPSSPTGTSCTISGLNRGGGYTFSVTSANQYATSAASAASAAVGIAATAPSAATLLSASPGVRRALLTLTPPVDSGGTVVTGYDVSTDGGSTWTALVTTASTGGTLTAPLAGLANGTTYQVLVRADNAAGVGIASAALPVTTWTTPAGPSAVSASAGREGATVSWSAPARNGGTAVSGYTVSYRDLTDPAHTVLDRVGAGATSDTAALIAGEHYSVSVAAANAVGPGAAALGTTVVPFTNPLAPTGLTAAAAGGSATVRWVAPVDTGYTAITGYRLQVTDQTTGGVRFVTVGPVPATTVGGLTAGHRYSFAAFSLNAAGASAAASASATLTLPSPTGSARTPPPAVPPTQRRHEIPVPVNPTAVHGPVRLTVAYGRSHDGTAALLATALGRYPLRPHQAVMLSGLFGYNSSELTSPGRALLRTLVVNLRGTTAVTCEGYTDYQVAPGDARRLSTARARAVCLALRADGAHVRTTIVGYGGQDPVAVGGTIRQRGLNRRAVLYIDR